MTDHTASELLSLLVALDGYCHFDETGCECTDEYAALKARARVICAAACAAADEKDEQIEFLVTATCINPDGPSDAEDEDVPEITSVFIPAGTRWPLLAKRSWTTSTITSAWAVWMTSRSEWNCLMARPIQRL